nr:intraflagellar transport protein 80 homolog [Onthophagus taurus]
MKLKVTVAKNNYHKAAVTCLSWSTTEEVYSAGDDNQLLCWNVSNNEAIKVTDFKAELLPTDLHFLPRIGGALGKHGDLILITSTDGKFHIVNKSGRIERSVEAHKGAILSGQWSNDGSSLLTAGEDGFIKIWSRSGMLRSTIVSSDFSVYGVSWSPDNQSIVYTSGKFIVIKNLAPNTKPHKWKAHEGITLCLSWSSSSELIISGGEDCRYRVWDNQGRQLFSSNLHDHPITSMAWSPNGDLFAVGSYNTLRLCDRSGWSQSLEKPSTGCIYKISWSSDGTQLAGACANGHVLFAHIVERQVSYLNYVATVTERKVVVVKDVLNDATEVLDLPERVIQMSLRYNHLVLTTPIQCYIYATVNWNTPTIFDLKDGCVILLLLTEKHFLLVEKTTVGLYNYQGRLIASPRWPNMRLDNIRNWQISLSPDVLVIRDASDTKLIHIVDITSNRSMMEQSSTIQHSNQVLQISLNQSGGAGNRIMAVLDKNKDVYVISIKSQHKTFSKLGGQIQGFQWNSDENMLAAIQDTHLVVWYCPSACFEATLLRMCSFVYDSLELSRSPKINDFVGNSVSIRRSDGSLLNVPISPFPALLHRYIQDGKWTDALNICRTTEDVALWTCLAVLATQSQSADTLDVAEEAYAAINQFDKVFYIQHLKEMPTKAQQLAGAALLGGSLQTAESILIHNGMVYQAILINLQLFNWDRALDLATKHKSHIDTVLYVRQRYLDKIQKQEVNEKFVKLRNSVNIDEEKIKLKMEQENNNFKN